MTSMTQSASTDAPSAAPLLHRRVAVVIGASRGIGAASAGALAEAGATVVLAARDAVALDARVREITAAGGVAHAVPVDTTDPASVDALTERVLDDHGRLDIAFNNATDNVPPARLVDLQPEDFDHVLRSNVHGTFLAMRRQIPAMLATGGGSVVNMASGAGVQGVANLAGYVAGKAGVVALTKVAALEHAADGVRVNVLAPGPILTHHLEAAGETAQQHAAASTPMRRVGSVDDVSHAVLWLCSPGAGFVTGAVLPIDGGQSAGTKPPQMHRQGQPMAADPPSDQADEADQVDQTD